MNKYPFNCVLSCFQRLPASDLNVHRRSYPPALFFKISDWTLSTWKHVLCSGVNAELYCVVCMWAMSTFAVAYLPLLLIGFLLAPLSYACLYSTHSLSPTWIRMGAGFTVFVIWNDILQFCPRRFHCRWKELRGEEMWFYPHAVWARCAVYGDLFGCLTAEFLPFPMPDFIPIFIPSAMGLLWLAHFLLPVFSWMCHPYSSALASTWIQWCHVYLSRITPPPLSWPRKSYSSFAVWEIRNLSSSSSPK